MACAGQSWNRELHFDDVCRFFIVCAKELNETDILPFSRVHANFFEFLRELFAGNGLVQVTRLRSEVKRYKVSPVRASW
jgi:hypothetical protein